MAMPEGTRLGPVTLAVTDRERALVMWRDVVGLTVLDDAGGRVTLGAGGKPLIVLEAGAERPVAEHTSGLYHVAIHVPTRRELARLAARMMGMRVPNSPTDHLVSEALYLWDLDGNGIEMTFETPWRGELKSDGDMFYGVTRDGRRHSGRDAIDLDGLFAELQPDDDLRAPLPAGTRIGHVHLHVADLDDAMRFYSETIGFPRQMLNRRARMGDVTLGYQPHVLAFNTWAGTGAPQPPPGTAGLRHFTIELPDAAALAAVRERIVATGSNAEDIANGFAARDPAGNRVHVTVA